jgi:1-acyl-sn-glycerol-3-phosphate acyltransferase
MGGRWRRRVVTLPVVCMAFIAITVTFPLLALAAAALDVVGRREALVDRTYRIQAQWARALFAAVRWLFGLTVKVEGDALLSPGSYVLFVRHASIVDTLLPTVLVSARHGIRLRFVLKRELLMDPCLDVAGLRLPNYFVDRAGPDSEAAREGIAALGRGLGPRDGALIYPEGTRFTEAKRRRAIERLRETDADLAERAARLTRVLPPRLGGSLSLLDAAPDADAIFFAHAGLDGLASVWDIARRGLGTSAIRVAVWRVAADRIPRARDARVRWLYDEWQRMNDWVEASLAALPSAEDPP